MPRIRAIVSQEDDWWCVQCLDYDIAVQARTKANLKEELIQLIVTHLAASTELRQPAFAGLPRAPERFFRFYDAMPKKTSEELLVGPADLQSKLHFRVPEDALPIVVSRS